MMSEMCGAMPRQHLEDKSLCILSSNAELPRSVQYPIGLCFTHKKDHFLMYLHTCISLQEMQEEARKKKPKEIIVSSSSRLAG